ncbi:MAG TPA: hypothetical protein VLE45_09890 [Burkholderiaceae bacterium]|nr:hypothetical protein [Burkholderiaceae bacterium]
MSLHSRISASVSPLLWLAPLPFVLAMCLPVQPRSGSAPGVERVASSVTAAPAQLSAASAPRAAH